MFPLLLTLVLLSFVFDLIFAADLTSACQPLMAAMEKSLAADHATATTRAGKTTHGVTSGGVNHIEVNGKWRKSAMTPQEVIAHSRENLKDAKSFSCSSLPDSTVNSTAASNYVTSTVTEDGTEEGKMSISKATGRVVQVENNMKDKDGHFVTQYSYDNVKVPM